METTQLYNNHEADDSQLLVSPTFNAFTDSTGSSDGAIGAITGDPQEGGAISDLDLTMSEQSLTIVRVPLIGEMRQELEALIQRKEWEWQEGLVTVLATGISQLSAQDRAEAPASSEMSVKAGAATLDPVTQELAYYHSMYSAMKFRAFSLLEKLKVLEMREAALKGKLDLDAKWAEAERTQVEALQAENAQLKHQVAELVGESLTSAPTQPAAQPLGKRGEGSLLGKLQAFLSR